MRKSIGLFFVLLMVCFVGVEAQAQSPGVGASLTLNWLAPTQRENGAVLTAAEIGGYEIRYRTKNAAAFSSVVIPNGLAKSYVLAGLSGGEYDVQIAAFDTDGLYSNFIAIAYKLNTSPPKAVSDFGVKRQTVNVLELCKSTTTCKVVSGDGL